MKSEKKGVPPSIDELMTRMKLLEEQTATLQIALDEKDKKILALEAVTEAGGDPAMTIMGRMQERSLGKKKVPSRTYNRKTKEYDQGFTEIEMFEYLVDLAPNQGTEVRLNGIPFQHNTVVEIDLNTLRSLKEIIFRGWWHESQVNGTQESKFRHKSNAVFSMKTNQRVA